MLRFSAAAVVAAALVGCTGSVESTSGEDAAVGGVPATQTPSERGIADEENRDNAWENFRIAMMVADTFVTDRDVPMTPVVQRGAGSITIQAEFPFTCNFNLHASAARASGDTLVVEVWDVPVPFCGGGALPVPYTVVLDGLPSLRQVTIRLLHLTGGEEPVRVVAEKAVGPVRNRYPVGERRLADPDSILREWKDRMGGGRSPL